ncbi:MAG: sugar phosphate isomerase/epimerase family protein [Gemmatimonadota bacterium]|nr:sugar phosphate isomerase/epimerase family protein [Gemmatimonadota bacterium]
MQIKYFASVSYTEVTAAVEMVKPLGMHLEIEVMDPRWILEVCELPVVGKLGGTLNNNGIRVNVQGPFLDLAPGSLDTFIRDHTRKLFLRTLDIAEHLGARYVTFYSGYNPLLHSAVVEQWLEVCLPLWREVAEAAEKCGTIVLISNLFEQGPEIQLRIIEACKGLPLGACLDLAHAFIYSNKKITAWVRALEEHLKLAHLNDTKGRDDEHLAVGRGNIPFKDFYNACLKREVKSDMVFKMPLDQALQSLRTVHSLGLGQYQMKLL